MNNKRVLYLLLCGLMLYYSVPRLSINTDSAQGIFSLFWLALAMLAVGGNLSELLYAPKKVASQKQSVRSSNKRDIKKHLRRRG